MGVTRTFVRPEPDASGPTARLIAISRGLFLVLIAVFGVARLAGLALPTSVQAAVYLGAMGSVSLLHGGFEHVANLKGRGDSVRVRYLLAYLALVAVSLGAYVLAPAAGLALAVGVTVLKGGYGGLAVRRRTVGAPRLGSHTARAVGALVRGGAVMIVPYVLHPRVYSAVSTSMVALFDPAAAAGVLPAFARPVRLAVGGWYAGLVLGYLAYLHATATDARWRGEAAEVLLLVAYFAVVPPVVAVGVYFPCWYATRQVARMTAAGDADPSLASVATRVLRGGALPWAGAVCLLAGLALVLPVGTDPLDWIALYSVFVAAIALPHVVFGAWLDRTRGIWSVA